MIITKDIKKAIRSYLESRGISATSFSIEQGLARATVTRWLSGKTKEMRVAQWNKLKPMLLPYLKKWEGSPIDGSSLSDTERYEFITSGERQAKEPSSMDPLASMLMDKWPTLEAEAQLEILRILKKYEK